jgi:MFS family permease
MIGVYLSAQMAGAALSNLLWGWLGDRYGNRSVIVGTAINGGLAPLFVLLAPRTTLVLLPTEARQQRRQRPDLLGFERAGGYKAVRVP